MHMIGEWLGTGTVATIKTGDEGTVPEGTEEHAGDQ